MLRAMVIDPGDSVATVISEGGIQGAECTLVGARTGAIRLRAPVPYGHKVAIQRIIKGGEVLKYKSVIGLATQSIEIGDHVHVHNVGSVRGRGDLNTVLASGATS